LSLDKLGGKHRIALVSNIDDDLLQATPVPGGIDLVCTAERARGYKPDGTLFRYLIANAGVAIPEILHSGQSQHTDMVGGKPLGLTVTWISRRNLELHPSVPSSRPHRRSRHSHPHSDGRHRPPRSRVPRCQMRPRDQHIEVRNPQTNAEGSKVIRQMTDPSIDGDVTDRQWAHHQRRAPSDRRC
jgi:hypothetical protein